MIGSVFSPYYAWKRRRDPLDHCALNIGLYCPSKKYWAMTERGRSAVHAERSVLSIGPSAIGWVGDSLVIDIDETTAPLPSRLKGQVRLHPEVLSQQTFSLDPASRHKWQPVAPRARIEVDLPHPGIAWRGSGYLDTNAGEEPLEQAFSHWNWSHADVGSGAAVLYHASRLAAPSLSLALHCDRSGKWEAFEPPRLVQLPKSNWGIERATYADEAGARVERSLEDGPFYARSLLDAHLFGVRTTAMHEAVSLQRFATPWVKAMLPFRMPRAFL